MNIYKFRAMDRASRKQILYEMHLERIRLESIQTPVQMQPFLDELHLYEDAHERAKISEKSPQSFRTFWSVLLED